MTEKGSSLVLRFPEERILSCVDPNAGDITKYIVDGEDLSTRLLSRPVGATTAAKGAKGLKHSSSFTSNTNLSRGNSMSNLMQTAQNAKVVATHVSSDAVLVGYEDGAVNITYFNKSNADAKIEPIGHTLEFSEVGAHFEKTEEFPNGGNKSAASKERETQLSSAGHPKIKSLHGVGVPNVGYCVAIGFKESVAVVFDPFDLSPKSVTLHTKTLSSSFAVVNTSDLEDMVDSFLSATPHAAATSGTNNAGNNTNNNNNNGRTPLEIDAVVLSPCMRFLSITLSVPYPLVLVLSLPRLTPETTARPPTGREKSVERGDVVFQLHKSDVVGYVEAPEEEQGALAEGERISAKCFFLANHESVSETLFVVWEGALTYVRMCLTAPPKPFLVHERKSSIRDTASKKGKPRVTSVLSKTAAASSESNPPLLLCATGQLAAPIQSSLSVDDRYVVIACQRGGVYVMDHVELYGGAAAFDSTDSAGCVSTHSKVLSAAVHKGGVCALVSSTLGTGEERQFVLACTSVSVENKAPSPPRFMTALPGEVVSAGWVGCLPLAMISIANSQTLLWDTTFHYLVGQLPITPYQSSTVRAGAAHLTYLDYATADGEVSLRPSLLPATSLTAMVYPLFAVYFPGLPVFSVAAILRQVPPTDRLTSSLSNTELASLDVQGERTEEDYDRSVPPRWGEVPADAHALRWLSHLQHSSGARKVWLDRMIEQSSE